MASRTRTRVVVNKAVHNENLIGRQKKIDNKSNVPAKRTILSDLGNNILGQPVANIKKTVAQSSQIKKPTRNIQPNKPQECIIVDVDAKDAGDPYLVPEYVQDIFKYLRTVEEQYAVKKSYLAAHRSTSRMRSLLVNWMIEVQVSFQLMIETLHLSVAILDRYLQVNTKVGKETLQLVGITAMIIASKYEEIHIPSFENFADTTDNYFTCDDIKKMEVDMLVKLKFEFGRPLSLQFLRRYNKVANATPEQHNLAKYLLEICLLQYELCHIHPSLQAAASCCLSKSILNEVLDPCKVWTKSLTYYTSYKYTDIKSTVTNLAYFLYKMNSSKYLAVKDKYAGSKYGKISSHPKLQGPLVKKLVDLSHQKT